MQQPRYGVHRSKCVGVGRRQIDHSLKRDVPEGTHQCRRRESTPSNLTRGHYGSSGYTGLCAYAGVNVPQHGPGLHFEGPFAQRTRRPNPSVKASPNSYACKPRNGQSYHRPLRGLHAPL